MSFITTASSSSPLLVQAQADTTKPLEMIPISFSYFGRFATADKTKLMTRINLIFPKAPYDISIEFDHRIGAPRALDKWNFKIIKTEGTGQKVLTRESINVSVEKLRQMAVKATLEHRDPDAGYVNILSDQETVDEMEISSREKDIDVKIPDQFLPDTPYCIHVTCKEDFSHSAELIPLSEADILRKTARSKSGE